MGERGHHHRSRNTERIIREYYIFLINKLDNSDEMNKFLEIYKLPKFKVTKN